MTLLSVFVGDVRVCLLPVGVSKLEESVEKTAESFEIWRWFLTSQAAWAGRTDEGGVCRE